MGNNSSYTNDILAGSGNLFTFKNTNCETRIDTTHDKSGNEIKTLRIRNTQNTQSFNYKTVEGLYPINKQNHNLLAELLSLSSQKIESLNNFFEKYGFFIPISSEIFEIFSYQDLYCIIARIRTLLELVQEVRKITPDYNLLFRNTTLLQFANSVTLNNESGYTYKTCVHFLKEKLETTNFDKIDVPSKYIIDSEEDDMPFARVPDSMNPTGFTDIDLNTDELFFSYTYESLPPLLPYFYTLLGSCFDCGKSYRNIIELYYHMESLEIMNLKYSSFDVLTGPQFSKQTNLNQKTLDTNLQKRIVEVAKTTIKTELEYVLKNIRPSYDSDTALGTWNIPDFLSALYFSIFYMRPNLQILRLCENPYCNNYFTVTSTNSRKKYCCHECANAVAQRAYRSRKPKA